VSDAGSGSSIFTHDTGKLCPGRRGVRVEVGAAVDHERLQLSLVVGEITEALRDALRDVAVEARGRTVLGLVHDPVEPGHGLVREPAGGLDRDGRDGPVGRRGDLEGVAVRDAGRVDVVLHRSVVEDLLAGDPRAPGGLATGAVRVRAGKHAEALDDVAMVVHDQLCVAPTRVRVGVVAQTIRNDHPELTGSAAVLVVADQHGRVALAGKRAHTVEDAGCGVAVAHRVALL
jgi:hypothetical protein